VFILGLLLVVVGGAICVNYANRDTSVAVPEIEGMGGRVGGGRVVNLSLMEERRNGMMIGGGVAIVGVLCVLTGLVIDAGNRRAAD
jgi:hypothetical protein